MPSDDRTPPQIQETDHLVEEGHWFRHSGKGVWHLQAHQEYGVVWSLCGVRMRLAQAETLDHMDPEGGQAPCPNCRQRKAHPDARERG
jgi:hypothetical protein